MRKALVLFGVLDDLDIEWLASVGRPMRTPTGTRITTEGEPVDDMLVVMDGVYSISLARLGGAEIDRALPGEILGEMSFVDSRPASATVTASTASTVLAIPKDEIQFRLDDDAPFAARFYRALAMVLSERLRSRAGLRRVAGGAQAAPAPPGAAPDDDDDISPEILENLHLAGARFDRLLRRFASL